MILHFNNNPLRLRTSAEKPEKIETISFIALLISWKLGQVAKATDKIFVPLKRHRFKPKLCQILFSKLMTMSNTIIRPHGKQEKEVMKTM